MKDYQFIFNSPAPISIPNISIGSDLSNRGLAAYNPIPYPEYTYGREQQRMRAVDSFNANPQLEPVVNFHDTPTNTSVSDGNLYIYDQRIDGRMYNPYTKRFGTRSDRNINPGNITGAGGRLLYGASRIARGKGSRADANLLVFPDARTAWRGMYSLMNKDMYNNAPIRQAFSKYQEDKAAWNRHKNDLINSGIDIDKRFKDLPLSQQILFMNKRARLEGWTGKPVTIQDIS